MTIFFAAPRGAHLTGLFRAGLFFCLLAGLLLPQAAYAQELRLLASTFPVYLLTRNVTRDCPDVNVSLLIPARTGCPHEYALSPGDLQKLAQAQVLVLNGLGLEDFLAAPLRQVNTALPVIDSATGITPLPLFGAGGNSAGHAGHGHAALNPHIFASPRHAARMALNIAEGLAALDAERAPRYRAAAQACAERLLALADSLAQVGAAAPRKGLVLQHDALAYLAQDAGLTVMAVVQEDEEQAPSAARLLELSRTIRQEQPVLLVAEPQYSDKAMQTLSRESNVPMASLDPATSGPEDAPLDYYETVMAANRQILEAHFVRR